MSLSILSIETPSLQEYVNGPSFPFIERQVSQSSAYGFANSGRFLVAPENSPTPKFAYKFQFPQILSSSQESIRELLFEMNSLSSGFLWFDRNDVDAHALCMRSRLRVKVSSILFGVPTEFAAPAKQLTIQKLDDTAKITALAHILKPHTFSGGIDKLNIDGLLKENAVTLILDEQKEIGLATILPLSENYVAIGGVVDDQQKHRSADIARSVIFDLVKQGKKPLYGVSAADERGCMLAQALGLPIVNISYVAQLGDF